MNKQTQVASQSSHVRDLPSEKKMEIPVSKKSRYKDPEWDFSAEIPNLNFSHSRKIINWQAVTFCDGTRLTDSVYAKLIESSKDLVLSLMRHPSGGGGMKPSSLANLEQPLKDLLQWMVKEKLNRFSQLDRDLCGQYIRYTKSLNVSMSWKVQMLKVLNYLYVQRFKLSDAIHHHPFNYEDLSAVVGYNSSEKEKNRTKRIPEEILVELLQNSLEYVEKRSSLLINLQDDVLKMKKNLGHLSQNRRNAKIAIYLKGKGFVNAFKYIKEIELLRTACYIIIAFFSGMRDCELASIKEGCVRKVLSRSGHPIYKIFSIENKHVKQPREDYWLIPAVVKTAVDVLTKLTYHLRARSGFKELFLCEHRNRIKHITDINTDLKTFLFFTGVPPYKGEPWPLTAHQFRRSFAYYMMKENRCNIRFIRDQLKHINIDMALWYAETSDEELKHDVYSYSVDITRELLRPIIFGDDPLAGKGGEQIMKSRMKYFYGMTARKKESLFEEITRELYVRGTYLGLCIWNPETAKCDSDSKNRDCEAGFECRCNPNTCKNAVVTREHLPIWIRLKERHDKLLLRADLEPKKRQYLEVQRDTFVVPILKKLGYLNSDEGSK